jgi:hypothetical protein
MAKISQLAEFNFFLSSQPKTIEIFLKGELVSKIESVQKMMNKTQRKSDDDNGIPSSGK